jgi:hypothetical protein
VNNSLEDAHYTLTTQYDPDLDRRLKVKVRVDATDRTFIIDEIRVDEEPAQ